MIEKSTMYQIDSENSSRWKTAIALGKMGWWEADFEREVYVCSDPVMEMLGLEGNEITFEQFIDHIREDYRERVTSNSRYHNGTDVYDQRFPIVTSKGDTLWVLSRAAPDRIDPDGVKRATGFMQRLSADEAKRMETDAQKRLDDLLSRQRAITDSMLAFLSAGDTDEVMNNILREMLKLFRGSRVAILEFDKKNNSLSCSYEALSEECQALGLKKFGNRVPFQDYSWWMDYILSGTTLVFNALDEIPPEASQLREALKAGKIQSIMVAPLFAKEGVWGYVSIDSLNRSTYWNSDDYEWLSSLSNIISICLLMRRSETAAEKEHRYLSNLYQCMPVAYLHLRVEPDGQYVVQDTNVACDRILEKNPEEYLGKPTLESGLNIETVLPHARQVVGCGGSMESTMMTSNGRICHAYMFSLQPDELVLLFSDMTETFRAYDELERKEAILRNIYDNLPAGIELYDKDGIMVDLNERELEIFGLSDRREALGLSIFDNPAIPGEVKELLRQGKQASLSFQYDFGKVGNYFTTKRTGVMDCSSKGTPLYDSAGKLIYYLFIHIDNTEIFNARNQIEQFKEFFTLIGDYAKVGYALYNAATEEGYAIDSWYETMGEQVGTPLKEIFGVAAHVHPEDREKLLVLYQQMMSGDDSTLRENVRVIHPNGSESWTCINLIVRDYRPAEGLIEFVCINYDITDLKRLEENLILAKEKAESSDRLKSAFLANMSHEIRTPLNAIVGFSEVLAEATDVEEKKEYVHIIEHNNHLLLQLICDILDISKIEAGTLEFNDSQTELAELFEGIESSALLRHHNPAVEIRFIPEMKECRVMTDKIRLTQVVTNLINNAMKFTETGHIRFGFRLKDPETLYCYVTDTGCGIAADKKDQVFDRFVKLNNFVQGTGLGLSICQTIVKHMGGEIGVESEEGKGSTFWFTIPYRQSGLAKTEPPPRLEVDVKSAGEKLTILIAEDNESNFKLFEAILKNEYNLIHAWDGEQAIELFRKHRPQMVLMDINMPVMNGYEATRCIRELSSSVPIIAVTAYAFEEDEQRMLTNGFDAYAAKPVKAPLLKKLITELISKRLLLIL